MSTIALRNNSATKKVKKEITISKELILLRNNLVELPLMKSKPSQTVSGTVFANLAYYGFVLSKEAVKQFLSLDDNAIENWWIEYEPMLQEATGDNKDISSHVVYKNFPEEVLNMTQGEYWFNQILMYIGLPNQWFTQPEEDRDPLNEKLQLKVLHLAKDESIVNILIDLLKLPAKWNDEQLRIIKYLIFDLNTTFDIKTVGFKENLVKLCTDLVENNVSIELKSAMDVLRLAVSLSDGDITLKTNTKFKKFNRAQRRYILNLLENTTNPEEDFARDSNKWLKLIRNLHPGDYKKQYPRINKLYDLLYNGKLHTFNSKVETLLLNKDLNVFVFLKNRPGEFIRRLNKTINIFGKIAATEFKSITINLKVSQLLKLKKYLQSCNERKQRTFAPKGNWTKLQIVDSDVRIDDKIRLNLIKNIDDTIKGKIKSIIRNVRLSEATKMVKLQTNDSELTPYGRGTVFPIPDNVNFLRSASYWEDISGYGNSWFDNGWNFFDENWNYMGACSWTFTEFSNKASIFSGDPTNTKTADGKACQLIDLYLDKLEYAGVRYAVWNILCFSQRSFNTATEVFGALQWGDKPQQGKLFEPSRCQLSFQLKGDNMTKYIAYVDVKERKLIYMDANLSGDVSDAARNGGRLEKSMPAFVEYLNTIPSVYDLFESTKQTKKGTVITYDDLDVKLKNDEKAFVFKPSNEKNKYTPLEINELLNL